MALGDCDTMTKLINPPRHPRAAFGALPDELTGRPGVKSSTIGRWLAANRYAHRLIGLPPPMRIRTTFLASGIWGTRWHWSRSPYQQDIRPRGDAQDGRTSAPEPRTTGGRCQTEARAGVRLIIPLGVDMSRLRESRLAPDTDEHALSSFAVGLYCLGVKVDHSIAAGPQNRLSGIKEALGSRLRSRLNNNVCLNATADVT